MGNPKHRFHLKSFLFDRPALPAPGVWPLLLLTFRLKSSAQLLKSDSEEESDNEQAIWSTTYQIKKHLKFVKILSFLNSLLILSKVNWTWIMMRISLIFIKWSSHVQKLKNFLFCLSIKQWVTIIYWNQFNRY